jgi:hypothetical protein
MRKDFIGFKVTEQENERIRKKTERAKVNLSTYVRTSALEKAVTWSPVCLYHSII